MSNTIENNKRIAKNTLFLYFRMLFIMLVSLYTSRIILTTLGVQDYGIYNVVGGVVAMFSLVSASLSSAISRFITYELGRGELQNLKRVFSSAITIQLIISLIIILLAETIGLWFLNNKMVIPENRIVAANYVYQFSLITFVLNLISVPYNAAIIAHEKMEAFAYISIIEVLGKLMIVFAISYSSIDKLIIYSFLITILAVVIRIVYGAYCKKYFDECKFSFIIDKDIFTKMFGFAGWNFIGSIAAILRDSGGNIVINLFFGPAVNAARAISNQVNSAIYGFASNFMIALNPQITKSYARRDIPYLLSLISNGARLSYFMLLILSVPILLNTEYIISLWLNQVPAYTVDFVRLTLIFAMSESISSPLITAMLATGKIKNFQIICGGLQLLNLPLSYVLFKLNYPPQSLFILAIIISQLCFFARLYMVHRTIGISMFQFIKKVYMNVLFVSLLSLIFPIILLLNLKNEGFILFINVTLCSLVCTLISILYLGCNKKERQILINKLIQIKTKLIINNK